MIKKLTKHGNSMALVLDKPILELLNIKPDTPLEIETDGSVLLITPVQDTRRKAKFKKAVESVNRRYAKTFSKLAE